MISVDDALATVATWQRNRLSQSAHLVGISLAAEVKRLQGEIQDLRAAAASSPAGDHGDESGSTEIWPDFVARIQVEVERMRAEGGHTGKQCMSDIHLHFHCNSISCRPEDKSMAGRLDNVEAMLTTLVEKVQQIMAAIDDLRTQVERTTTLEGSAIAMIQGLAQQIQAAAGDQAAVEDLASQLSTNADALAAALAANTPSDTGGGDSGTTEPATA